MSDITYARKADELTQVDPDDLRDPERLALALVHATQGVARANREIDGKLKYVADQIVKALSPDPWASKPERWITWGEPGDRVALAVHRIETFAETERGTFVSLVGGEEIDIPVSYGEVALMVGAV